MRPSPCVTSCGRVVLKCIGNKGISMVYRDKDKQRATTRERVRRYRENKKDVTPTVTPTVTPEFRPAPASVPVAPGPVTSPFRDDIGPDTYSCKGCKLLVYQPGKGLACPKGAWPTAATAAFEQHLNPHRDCTGAEQRQEARICT